MVMIAHNTQYAIMLKSKLIQTKPWLTLKVRKVDLKEDMVRYGLIGYGMLKWNDKER